MNDDKRSVDELQNYEKQHEQNNDEPVIGLAVLI